MKTFVIDIDGTICTNTYGEYTKAEPFYDRIIYVNKLFKEGHKIKFFTARGSGTGINWLDTTKKQLCEWGVNYHELLLGKPEGDIFIDDKAFNSEKWNWNPNDKVKINNKEDIEYYEKNLRESINVSNSILIDKDIQKRVIEISEKIKIKFKKKGKIIFAGNGGSFADSQHISAEFVARFSSDRIPLPSIALGTNSSNLTAIGNDFGFEKIFSRELEAIVNQNDLFIAISTSGNSENIINAVEVAKKKNIDFYIFTGENGGKLNKYSDKCLKIPSKNTAIIQQCHINLAHIIVGLSEKDFL